MIEADETYLLVTTSPIDVMRTGTRVWVSRISGEDQERRGQDQGMRQWRSGIRILCSARQLLMPFATVCRWDGAFSPACMQHLLVSLVDDDAGDLITASDGRGLNSLLCDRKMHGCLSLIANCGPCLILLLFLFCSFSYPSFRCYAVGPIRTFRFTVHSFIGKGCADPLSHWYLIVVNALHPGITSLPMMLFPFLYNRRTNCSRDRWERREQFVCLSFTSDVRGRPV
jgi:hypothetical protein